MTFARGTSRSFLRAALLRALPCALPCALAVPGCGWARADVHADSPFAGGNEAAAVTAWELETGAALPFPALPSAVDTPGARGRQARWTAHVAFEINGQIDLYASYATGYKARSVNLARGSRPFGAEQLFLDAPALAGTHQGYSARFARPEDTKVYEIGMRADWGPANANLALFQQSITGSQSSVLASTGFVLAQAGHETVRGAEIEASLRPARGWLVSAAVTYLDARYERFAVSAAGDLSGMRPAGIPAFSATVGAARQWPLAGGARLILRGDFHYQSPTQIQQALPGASALQPTFSRPMLDLGAKDFAVQALDIPLFASARGDAAIGAAAPFKAGARELGVSLTLALKGGLECTLWGRNIANNRYQLTLFDPAGQPYAAWGYANQPQSFGTTVRVRY